MIGSFLGGAIDTAIRALLKLSPMKKLHVMGDTSTMMSLKLLRDLPHVLAHAISGTAKYGLGTNDDLEDLKRAVMRDMNKVLSQMNKSGVGLYLKAFTLGSLEVLIELLRSLDTSIPFSGFDVIQDHDHL